jgi:hypothetical protein
MVLSRRFEGKKFVADGQVYPDAHQAQEAARKYQADGFQVEVVAQDDGFYVFTRREVKEIVVEGNP